MKWAPDNDDGYLNFHSISGDGRVSNWTLVKVNFDVWGYMQYASWDGVGYTMSFGSAIHISRPLSGTLTSWFLTLGSLCTILLKSSSPASSKVNFSRTVGGHIFVHWSKTDSGRAFAFKPDEPDLYLVGTGGKIYGWNAFWFFPVKLLLLKQCSDEGVVYLCTTQYASTYINIFQVKQRKKYSFTAQKVSTFINTFQANNWESKSSFVRIT